ncbi:MAG TPA: ABC transporter substrate-binding protein [Nitrospinota bacterium]|nr:ABC transporter substrate-binding protein [Nitrospinota bacterium]
MKKIILFLLISIFILCQVSDASENILKIGMQNEPKTLNPFTASDMWSKNVIERIYEDLYTVAPKTFEIIPWVAEGPSEYNKENNTAIVKMRKAKWHDGTPVTAHDVVFTANVIKDFKVPRYRARWKFVKKIEAIDDYTIKYTLSQPMAIFYTHTLLSFIVQKSKWQPIVEKAKKSEKPLRTLLNYKNPSPLGNGAFKFVSWRRGSSIKLERNPDYFAANRELNGKKVGPYIDGILFKIYGTTDAAILALKKGDVDYIWWSIQPGYIDDLRKDPQIALTENKENGLRYFAFNLRKPPFNDKNFRHAVAYLINKDFMVKRILHGHGSRLDSIVPPGNEFWHNPDVPRYGKGMTKIERVKRAIEILKRSGYTWEKEVELKNNSFTRGEGLKMPNGKKVPDIDILTPPADYDPLRAMSGIVIQEWLKDIGINAFAKPASISFIIDKVKLKQDFDTFILGYRLGIDPDYIQNFFHSSQITRRGRNTSAYNNPSFDKLANESAKELEREKRRKIIFEMQSILMEDIPWIPLFNASVIEGYRKNRFSGWVNQLNGIGNYWSFLFIKPLK